MICIVRPVSSGVNVQIAWQAWYIVRVPSCVAGATFGADPSFVECHFRGCAVFRTLSCLRLPLSAMARLREVRYYLRLSRHSTWQVQYLVRLQLASVDLTLHTLHSTYRYYYSTLNIAHSTHISTPCKLHTSHSTRLTLHSSHSPDQSPLPTPHSPLYTPLSTLYILHLILHSTLHTLYTHTLSLYIYIYSTLHTSHVTLHTLHSTLYTPHSTVHNSHFTLCTLLHTLHSPSHSTP